jgi:hypothetical protein
MGGVGNKPNYIWDVSMLIGWHYIALHWLKTHVKQCYDIIRME